MRIRSHCHGIRLFLYHRLSQIRPAPIGESASAPYRIDLHLIILSPKPVGCWSERTEVHKAAYGGEATLLQRLIQNGASVNIVAVDSVTPLHEAAIRGQTECVRLLLDAGAQVSARPMEVDMFYIYGLASLKVIKLHTRLPFTMMNYKSQ